MSINIGPASDDDLRPKIMVVGVGGAGGNAIANMMQAQIEGVEFIVANTDAQALSTSPSDKRIQLGPDITGGLGAGARPEVGKAAAEETVEEIEDAMDGVNMVFIAAGMGGGTGTGAAPVIAEAARKKGVLTVGVVTKPFLFEGTRRMRAAEAGIEELQRQVDTLIVIPNQNLFRIANDKTTFADAFAMADQVLYSGVACITDLMVKEGLINLDFADVRSVMREMGRAMMGTGEASGEGRAMAAAEAAIANPLLDETTMKGAQGLLISITGGRDMTLFEVDEAATRIREEVDPDANIILGATFDEELEGLIRVSVVATGIDRALAANPDENRPAMTQRPAPRPAAAAPAAPVRPTQPQSQMAAPAAPAPAQPANDPVAETIRAAESELERELNISDAPAPAQPKAQADEFRPQSRIFASEQPARPQPAQPAPVAAAPRPAPQPAPQPVPAPAPQAAAPAPQPEPVRMPQVEDFPPVVKAEMESRQAAPVEHDERGPMGLLKRLSASLGKREDDEHNADHQQAAPAAQARRQLSPEASVYAPRRGQLSQPPKFVG